MRVREIEQRTDLLAMQVGTHGHPAHNAIDHQQNGLELVFAETDLECGQVGIHLKLCDASVSNRAAYDTCVYIDRDNVRKTNASVSMHVHEAEEERKKSH